MTLLNTRIKDCYLIDNFYQSDQRGSFIKIFNYTDFFHLGINFTPKESYYSRSKKNVIRGMHFQKKPHELDKLVTCIKGEIVDVILDLRIDSLTFGHFDSFILNEKNNQSIFVAAGVAHGFLAKQDDTITLYNVTNGYNRNADSGVLWNSFGFNWPVFEPVISGRDNEFLPFNRDDNFLI